LHIKDEIKMISLFKTPTYYVQIRKDSLSVRCANTGESVTLDASTPFSTKRLLIGEFTVAERLLQEAFSHFPKSLIRPITVMHPLEMVDETLSEVEEKVLREVAMAAGARDVKIWLGEVLTDRELLNV
jgi:hypothetical protein